MEDEVDLNNIRNFCIISHIDHGKSTLADRLLEITKAVEKREMREQVLDVMDIERERGITIKLQPARMYYRQESTKLEARNPKKTVSTDSSDFDISASNLSNITYELNLIDTPGHVDFSYEVSRSLAAVEGAVLLVDATQGIQAQTLANLELAKKANLKIIPAVNKIDLPQARCEEVAFEIAEVLGCDLDDIYFISAKTGEGVEKLLEAIIEKIPPPKRDEVGCARALVFDSFYDDFRGVVVYVKVVGGEFKRGEKIVFARNKRQTQISDLGEIILGLKTAEKLTAGQIGFVVTTFREVAEARVGETIMPLGGKGELLSGYDEPKPMVYAEFFSTSGEDYALLREALEKLKLNDSSFSYEPASSKAFGFGFKIGFLGLLHLEIVKERLEREYNLDLIITTPTVKYRTGATGVEEPWVKAEVMVPKDKVGPTITLIEGKRGEQKDIRHLEEKVILIYEMPLAEVIVDFYDLLKSATSGYGSVNYDLIGYREGDLVDLDVVIAEEKVEAFSRKVYRGFVEKVARQMVGKLKTYIPRQNFEVKIQAVVGGRIVAAERLAPYRKDVTEKLYGGDVTRKRKLLEKQKKGKRRMARVGKVEIPTKVFTQMLKY